MRTARPDKSTQSGFAPVLVVVAVLVVLGVGAYLYFQRGGQNNSFNIPNPLVKKPALFLTLDSPTPSTKAVNGSLLIKGKTLPNTNVVIFNDKDTATIESDKAGVFESQLMLGNGQNTVTVTAFGDDGSEKTLQVDVTYDSKSK